MEQRESQRLDSGRQPQTAGFEESRKTRRDLWRKAPVVLVILGAIVAVIVAKSSRSPRGAKGTRSEAAAFSPREVLATVNGEGITLAEVRSEFDGLPPAYRSQYRNKMDEFLDELITRRLLLQEARRLEVVESPAYKEALAGHSTHPGHEEEGLIGALLKTQVFDQTKVTDEELRSFYDEHKAEVPGGLAFEAVKETLRNSLLQQKQYEGLEKYTSELKQKANITRNEEWIKAQRALTADNPLDKALSTGRPVVADFGRGTCIPCKMMKPILEELAKEYKGKAEILIIGIDEYPFLATRCGVRVIPTQIFYDSSGNEMYRHEGFMPKEDIRDQLAKLGVK